MKQIITSANDYHKKEGNSYRRYIETKRVIMDLFVQNQQLSEIYSKVAGVSNGIDNCIKKFEDKLLLFFSNNIQYGIKQGFFHELDIVPIVYGTLDMIKYVVYKGIVLKEISKDEMIEMVISFHESLAIGLVKKEMVSGPT